jgi:hypothetical protein
MGFPVLVEVGLLIHEVEESIGSATSRKYMRIIHIHDLEEYLLPYLDGNTLHGETALDVWSVSCLEYFACTFLSISLNYCRKPAALFLTVGGAAVLKLRWPCTVDRYIHCSV